MNFSTNDREAFREAFRQGVLPAPTQTVSEWADNERFLSTKSSAAPGRWSTDRMPPLREIQDALSQNSPIEQIVWMKGAQVGGTEVLLNTVGYMLDHHPGPMMIVQPTVDTARDFSRQRLEPMLADNPRLKRLIGAESRRGPGRVGGKGTLSKVFPGGVLFLRGGNSPAGLRGNPIRVLCLDEVDSYPASAGEEGDPVGLAIRRTTTFVATRKILMVSTPTIAGISRIEAAYEETDKRRYFVPCPDCGHFQLLEFKNIRWTELGRPPLEAAYVCESCGSVWEESQKYQLLASGQWRPTAECPDPRRRGYHLSSLYSPWMTWGQVALQFLEAKDNEYRLQEWTNTCKGEPFVDRGEAPDWRRLYDRREDWPIGSIPEPVILLTAQADVQDDRLELLLLGWGKNAECWVIDWRRLPGDPARDEVWREVDSILDARYPHPSGAQLMIERLAIDTGGHHTQAVYRFGRSRPGRVMLIKGTRGLGGQIAPPPKRLRSGEVLWSIGTHTAKQQLYGMLRLDPPLEPGEPFPPRYVHCPKYSDEFFRQLTAERLAIVRNRRGYIERDFVQDYHRNEVLDLMVYGLAIAEALRLFVWSEEQWLALARQRGIIGEPQPPRERANQSAPALPARPTAPTMPRLRSFGPPVGGFGQGRWA